MGRWGHDGATAWQRGPEHAADVVRTLVMVVVYGGVTAGLRAHPSLLELAWPAGGLAALWLSGPPGRPRRTARDAALVLLTTVAVYAATGSTPGRGAAVGVVAVLTALVTTSVLARVTRRGGSSAGAAADVPGLRRPGDLVAVLVASLVGALVPALVAPGLLRALDGEQVPLVMWAWLLRAAAPGFVVLAVGLRLRPGVLEQLVAARATAYGTARTPAPTRAAGALRPVPVVEALVLVALVAAGYVAATRLDDPMPLVLTLLPAAVWTGLRMPTTWVAALVLGNAGALLLLAAPLPSPLAVTTTQVVVLTVSFSVLVMALHRDALADAARRERRARRCSQQQAELLEAVLAGAHEGVMVVGADGRVLLENAAARALMGIPSDTSRSVRQSSCTLHRLDGSPLPDDDEPVLRALRGLPTTALQALVHRSGGGESCVEMSARPLEGLEGGTGAVVTLHDVTLERRAARAVAERERLFRHALDASPLGLLVLPLGRGERPVLRSNPAMARLLGRTDLDRLDVLELADPTDAPLLRGALDAMADGVEVERFEVRLLGPGGQRLRCAFAASVVPAGDGRAEVVLLVEDVTERHEAETLLAHEARHDPLTGLPNRTLLVERLDALLAGGVAADARVGVVYLDLDGFKAVNDAEGHAVGDGLLREVARRLETAVRPGDTVARLGGDELVVVCPGLAGEDDLAAVASRVVADLGTPHDPPARHHRVTASAGTALADHGEDAADLLGRADAAMYDAKRAGGDRWCAAHPAPRRRVAAGRSGAALRPPPLDRHEADQHEADQDEADQHGADQHEADQHGLSRQQATGAGVRTP